MGKGKGKPQVAKRVVDDLEPYRRLIEIQKQLVQMSKEHELARRECDALRARIAMEVIAPRRWNGKVRTRIHRAANKLIKRLPRILTLASSLRPLNSKQPTSC